MQEHYFTCPYCWEQIELQLDCSVDCSLQPQEYIEDCSVCCRPMHVSLRVDEQGTAAVDVRSENE